MGATLSVSKVTRSPPPPARLLMRMQHKCFRPTANVTKEDKHRIKVQVRAGGKGKRKNKSLM